MNRIVLAEGEATGHAHRACGSALKLEDGVLSAPTGADVAHEEHGKITVPNGDFRRGIVQEFDQFQKQARQVVD